MIRKGQILFGSLSILGSCGPTGQSTLSSSAPRNGSIGNREDLDAKSGPVSVVLKSNKTVEAQSSDTQPAKSENKFSFKGMQLSLYQGESKEIEVQVRGTTPNGTITLTPELLENFTAKLLNTDGTDLTGPLKLNSDANGNFKIRVTSLFAKSNDTVTAPGPFEGKLTLTVKEGNSEAKGTIPVRVSNLAIYVMSGVTSINGLPKTFEFPAGTIPVFANPSTKIVDVMHFSGTPFKHQDQGMKLTSNKGYCPINNTNNNTAAESLVDPGVKVGTGCLPCPENSEKPTSGNFYAHGDANPSMKTITCRAGKNNKL